MKSAAVFMAEGFEEIEAITIIDLLRRGDISVDTISIKDENSVTGAHEVTIQTDYIFNDFFKSGFDTDISFENELIEFLDKYDSIILPGGQPGTNNLNAFEPLGKILIAADKSEKLLCAICAAPIVLSDKGILKNKKATAYPGCEKDLDCGEIITDKKSVVLDGNVLTATGIGTATRFSLRIIEILQGNDKAVSVDKAILN